MLGAKIDLMQTLSLPWHPYHVCFSSAFSIERRFAISSFEKSQDNWIKIFKISGQSVGCESVIPVPFPQTSICFCPSGSYDVSDMFISSSDYVKVWRCDHQGITNMVTINVNSDFDPITCLDWSKFEDVLAACGSTDGTLSALDLNIGEVISKIVAHDHPIYDVNFCGVLPTLISAGFEGSIRFFDLRDLHSSFVLYRTSRPLVRAKFSPLDQNYIISFGSSSQNVIVIDTRNPCTPMNVAKCKDKITSACWSNVTDGEAFISDKSGALYIINVNLNALHLEPRQVYLSNDAIQDFSFGHGFGAVSSSNRVEIVSSNSSIV